MPLTQSILDTVRGDRRTFVETGTWDGDGIQAALDAGFERIISIELDPGILLKAQERFSGVTRVTFVCGDSGRVLDKLAPVEEASCVFWLDAHPWGMTVVDDPKVVPLLRELDALAKRPAESRDVVLIDDTMFLGEEREQVGAVPEHLITDQPTWSSILGRLYRINADFSVTCMKCNEATELKPVVAATPTA